MRTRTLLPIALCVLVSACGATTSRAPYDQHPYYVSLPRCPVKPSKLDADARKECVGKPSVVEYLASTKRAVYDVWKLPRGINASQSVKAIFQIAAMGDVQCLSIEPDATYALANSVITAIERAEPFPALPSEASCLAEVPVVATFSNPAHE